MATFLIFRDKLALGAEAAPNEMGVHAVLVKASDEAAARQGLKEYTGPT